VFSWISFLSPRSPTRTPLVRLLVPEACAQIFRPLLCAVPTVPPHFPAQLLNLLAVLKDVYSTNGLSVFPFQQAIIIAVIYALSLKRSLLTSYSDGKSFLTYTRSPTRTTPEPVGTPLTPMQAFIFCLGSTLARNFISTLKGTALSLTPVSGCTFGSWAMTDRTAVRDESYQKMLPCLKI
jgi:hypothetical protein